MTAETLSASRMYDKRVFAPPGADPPARSVYLDPFYVLTPRGACYPVVGASLDIGAPSIKVSQDGHGLVAVIAPARDL